MTISRYDLLPPNATQLERDLSRATSSLVRVGGPVPIVRTAKRTAIPDSVVPWLIFEYGLSEILPFLGNDQRLALEEGIEWQRIRGTPASLRLALGWIGLEALIEESEAGSDRWAEYQLGLAEPTTGDQAIENIVGVADLSQPARCRLQRIYSGYDFRRAIYGESLWSDGAIYGDHSGVRLKPGWPQISYGRKTGITVPAHVGAGVAIVAHTRIIPISVRVDDQFRYGEDFWGEGWHTPNHPVLLTQLHCISASIENGRSWMASGHWGERTWSDGLPFVQVGITTTTDSEPPPSSNLEVTWTQTEDGGLEDYVLQPPTFSSTATTSTMTLYYNAALIGDTGTFINTYTLSYSQWWEFELVASVQLLIDGQSYPDVILLGLTGRQPYYLDLLVYDESGWPEVTNPQTLTIVVTATKAT